MGFLEHLDELRSRIIRACVAIACGMGVALLFYDRLGNFVLEPTLRVLPPGSELIFTRPSEMFAFYFNVALIGGIILAAPFVSYQVWRFISPGLHPREKRLVVPFVALATLGAIGGAAFSHYVLFPSSIAFFGAFTSPHVRFMPRIEEVFDQYLKMMLGMVLVFQLPPVVFVLARVGAVTARLMWRHFKYAVLSVFVLAAILTPSPDVWNQIAFATPMLALYLLSIGIAYLAGSTGQRSSSENHLRLVFAATVLESARRKGPRQSWAGRVV
jgi:sec-independent protein translocase protein TatC